MRNLKIYLIILSALVAASCANHVYRQTGFDMQIAHDSGGTTTLSAHGPNDIALVGQIQLDSGRFSLELVDPNGISIGQWMFDAAQPHTLDLKFTAVDGPWSLKYASEDGTGKVRITLRQGR